MNKTFDEIQEIYLHLVDMFYEGLMSFIVYRGLHRAYLKNPIDDLDIYLYTSAISSIKTLVLSLTNLLRNNPNSICLDYFENCILYGKKQFSDEIYEELRDFLKEFNNALDEQQSIVDKIVAYRDRNVAHIDKIHINNPHEIISQPPITIDDFEIIVSLIGSGLYEMGPHFGLPQNTEDLMTISNYILEQRTFKVYEFITSVDRGP